MQPEELERENIRRYQRYEEIKKNEARAVSYEIDDAEICIVAFGIASRVALNAMHAARAQGKKVGLIRPTTVWPFPSQALAEAAQRCKAFVCVELSMGQMIEDVELSIRCKRPVVLCNRVGGVIPSPQEVLAAIEKAEKLGGETL